MNNEISTPLNGAPLKTRVLDDVFRVTIVLITSALYALSVLWFLEPANLLSIGLSSLGQVLNRIFKLWNVDIPIGVFSLILNIPLCIVGIKYVSPRFIVYTMLSVIVQSILLLGFIPTPEFVSQIKGDTLFLSIIAGLLSGVGIGVALRYGTSTGGIDIVAQAVNLKKGMSIGVFSMMVNIVLAMIGAILAQNITIALYTFIFIIITNVVVDKIHTAYNYLRIDVITSKQDDVSKALLQEIKRGCTISNVVGAYTQVSKADVFMVISSYELDHAKRVINSVDPQAFIMVLPVKRVIGAFFKHTII